MKTSNIWLSRQILEVLASVGTTDVVFCAGARNSPLILQLEKTKGLRLWSFFDERSAGFFALGLSQNKNRPVAVITTSGTAVAELLPAAVEATYAQTPLIFVTADRPRRFRGTGSPQSIDQVGIFSQYVELCRDLSTEDGSTLESGLQLSQWSGRAPLQINVCFDEPLCDEEPQSLELEIKPTTKHLQADPSLAAETRITDPIVIAGGLSPEEARRVVPHLVRLGAPIYAEGPSNLSQFSELNSLLLTGGDRIIRTAFEKAWARSVLRVGGVPTLRFWRDLEDRQSQVPVVSVANGEWTGLARPTTHILGLENLSSINAVVTDGARTLIHDWDQKQTHQLLGLLERHPRSEVALVASLGRHLQNQFLYVGNSLPIREWDLASGLVGSPARVSANRGANGIDGQISSFLGQCRPELENWALVGDLTAMYDLSSLWCVQQMDACAKRLVIINNGGGQIFKNMFEKSIFLNQHQVEFQSWAQMWGWSYLQWTDVPRELGALSDRQLIELRPDPKQSEDFWRDYQTL